MAHKFILTLFLALTLLTLSCKKEQELNNPVDSQAELIAPTNLTITSMTTSDVSLSWTDNSSLEIGFEIWQSTDSINYYLIKTVGANVTSATITSVFDSTTTYYFRVRAKSQYSTSPYSNTSSFNIEAGVILVEGGTFTMGSPNGIGFSDEQPQHSVTLSDFYIDKFEVTQKRWRDIVQWKQTNGGTTLKANPSYFSGDSLPVERVSWNDIQTWLGYLNELDGLTSSPNKYRLPTEAEWEYAALGGKNWSDNYIYSGSNTIDGVSWYSTNSNGTTHTVGTKTANQLGIHDMSGNVWEWCLDYYSSGYYQTCKDLGTVSNPTGPTGGGVSRVLRGGSFYDDNDCRVALRNYATPDIRNYYCGFRLVRSK
jgi:formylglycine-generating enzyme required for sulfatase activity